MEIAPGTFIIGDYDPPVRVKLAGLYDTKVYQNKINVDWEQTNIHHWIAVFQRGSVLRRVETEGIDDLIELFFRFTYDPCKDVKGIERVQPTVLVGPHGKKYPNSDVFVFKGKMFNAYNRYTFGYDHYGREVFKREYILSSDEERDSDESSSSEEYSKYVNEEDSEYSFDGDEHFDIDKEENNSIITNDMIRLNGPKSTRYTDDYIYTLKITDQKTNVVDAFCLYR